ncbi:MAG TPA: hypothetical protein VGY31_05105 [Terriglobia bacterium]|nr:hypothetical protein [Terriglobia bacterium]
MTETKVTPKSLCAELRLLIERVQATDEKAKAKKREQWRRWQANYRARRAKKGGTAA